MTDAEIQQAVDDLLSGMMARGLVRPTCTAMISAAGEKNIHMHWDEDGMTYGRTELSHGESMSEAVMGAQEILASIPPKEDRDKAEFTRMLAAVIDKGRSIGVEVEFINPLTEMMKRLSENALTHAPD